MAPEVHYARNPCGAGWRMLVLSAVTLTVVAGLFLGLVRLLRRERRVRRSPPARCRGRRRLAVLTGLFMPALSYVFVWPALRWRPGRGWQVLGAEPRQPAWPKAAALAASGAMVAGVGVPLVYLLASAASIAAPMFAAVIAIFVALLGSLLVPHLRAPGRCDVLWVAPDSPRAVAVAGLGRRAAEQPDSVPSSHGPTTSSTPSTPTPGRRPGSPPGTSPDGWTEQFFPDGYTHRPSAFSPGYFFGQEFDVIEAPAPAVDSPAPAS